VTPQVDAVEAVSAVQPRSRDAVSLEDGYGWGHAGACIIGERRPPVRGRRTGEGAGRVRQFATLTPPPWAGESNVQEAVVVPLTAWANFYVITGSSAGALTGLTFVVVTLIGEARERGSSRAVAAFSTPTVVHFCAVLFVSALLSAPWQALAPAGLFLGVLGLLGVGYVAVVVRRLRHQEVYRPVLEDWLWHAILPLVAYTTLVVAALLLSGSPVSALFGIGAVMVLLLFIGIHNAWDTLTYLAVERFQPQNGRKDSSAEPP